MHCQEKGRYFFTLFTKGDRLLRAKPSAFLQGSCAGWESISGSCGFRSHGCRRCGCLTVRFIVVGAAHIGVIAKLACQQGQHGCIGSAADTAVKADASLRQGGLRAAANAAADQCINAVLF